MRTANDRPYFCFPTRTRVTLSDVLFYVYVSDTQMYANSTVHSVSPGPDGLPPAALEIGCADISWILTKKIICFCPDNRQHSTSSPTHERGSIYCVDNCWPISNP